jgi:hypothetical protein
VPAETAINSSQNAGVGQEYVEEARAFDPMKESGVTGLYKAAGIVWEEYLPVLRGSRAIKVWREMGDSDAICGALLFAIDKLMRQMKWSVVEGGESAKAKAKAEFVRECMDDMTMTWADVISEACSMYQYGWALLELCYKKRNGPDGEKPSNFSDGKIGWEKMALRSQDTLERWISDPNTGDTIGMLQRPPEGGGLRVIPMEKSLLFRTTVHKNNPEGRSVFRNGYRSWFFKKRIEEIEAIGIERDLAGLPVVGVDPAYFSPTARPDQIEALKEWVKIAQNLRRDQQEGVVKPNAYDANGNPLFTIELLSASGGRQFDTNTVINRYSQQLAMTVLADWLFLGHGATGSFALSSDKTNLFAVALGAWRDAKVAQFNDNAIPRLLKLNGMDLDEAPKIEAGDIESPDLGVVATFLGALTASGLQLFPNDDLVKWLFATAGFPEPTDEQMQQVGLPPEGTTPAEDAEAARLTGEA